jgi:iron complex outermembrane recepter protein
VFYVDWRKIQQIFLNSCAAGFIANTGSAVSKGFDLASEIALTEQVKVGLSVSYIDAYMTKTVTFDGALIVQAGDAVGSPPWVGSPWSVGGYAEYGFSLLSDRAYVRVEDFYRSENPGPFNTQVPGTPLYAPETPANPAYNQVNARFGLTHSTIDCALFVNNVTNSRPALYRYMDTVTSTLFTDRTLRPRTIGLTATYRF